MKAVVVASGKGGVGKSVVSINLARALAERGENVALVDADISNPTIFQLLGISNNIEFSSDRRIRPTRVDFNGYTVEVFSIESISKGRGIYKVGSEYARILSEIINYGDWLHDLFIVDSPAGLGDTHKVTVSVFDENYLGTVVVGVQAHWPEVSRVLEVHAINGIPVIGVIENMSGFKCSCGASYNFFSGSSLEEVCEQFNVPFLGSIPLDPRIGIRSPWIPKDLSTPIDRAVDTILNTTPRRPGFLEEIKEFIKDKAWRLVVTMVPKLLIVLNKVVPIGEIQAKFNLPGKRLIMMNLMEPDMVKVVHTFYFMVKDGKIVLLENVDPFKTPPYAIINIHYKALAWSIAGRKKDGTPYDFWTAFWNDHIRVSTSEGPENIQAFYFLANCIEYAKQYSGGEIQKIVEAML